MLKCLADDLGVTIAELRELDADLMEGMMQVSKAWWAGDPFKEQ